MASKLPSSGFSRSLRIDPSRLSRRLLSITAGADDGMSISSPFYYSDHSLTRNGLLYLNLALESNGVRMCSRCYLAYMHLECHLEARLRDPKSWRYWISAMWLRLPRA